MGDVQIRKMDRYGCLVDGTATDTEPARQQAHRLSPSSRSRDNAGDGVESYEGSS